MKLSHKDKVEWRQEPDKTVNGKGPLFTQTDSLYFTDTKVNG
jgi:hypothetical protein